MGVDLVGEQALDKDFRFVVGEILFTEIFSLLEDDHVEAVGGKFFCQHAAGRARANDYEIHFIGRFVCDHGPAHFFSVSPETGCQPG